MAKRRLIINENQLPDSSGGVTQTNGTYTPIIRSILGSPEPTYTTLSNIGRWVRTGNLIYIYIFIQWSDLTGNSSSIVHLTLPTLTTGSYLNTGATASIRYEGINKGSFDVINSTISNINGRQGIYFRKSSMGSSQTTHLSDWSSSGLIELSITTQLS
jgi:hypothetical protein